MSRNNFAALQNSIYNNHFDVTYVLLKTFSIPDRVKQRLLYLARTYEIKELLLEYCTPPINTETTTMNTNMNKRDYLSYLKFGEPWLDTLTPCRKQRLIKLLLGLTAKR